MDVERQAREIVVLVSRLSVDLQDARQAMDEAKNFEYTDDGGNWHAWFEAHDQYSYSLSTCAELQTKIIDTQQMILRAGAKCWDAPKGKKK